MSRKPCFLKISSRAAAFNPAALLKMSCVVLAVCNSYFCERSDNLLCGMRHFGQGHKPLKPQINAITHLHTLNDINAIVHEIKQVDLLFLIICGKNQNDREKPLNDIICASMVITHP